MKSPVFSGYKIPLINAIIFRGDYHGTRESQNSMPYKIYHAGLGLVTVLGLSKSEWREGGHLCERFALNNYAKSRLEDEVYGIPPVRIEVDLNLEYVEGPGSSGGGARGRI
ncbi:hypothetical protein ACT3R7_03160 [Halomonas sp. AOP43-A1-21]